MKSKEYPYHQKWPELRVFRGEKLLKKKVDDRSEMRVDRSYSTEGMEWKLASLIILTNFSIALLCRFNFCYRTRCCFDGKIDQEILTTCHIELASTRFRKKVRKKILRFGQFFLLFFYCDLNYFSYSLFRKCVFLNFKSFFWDLLCLVHISKVENWT